MTPKLFMYGKGSGSFNQFDCFLLLLLLLLTVIFYTFYKLTKIEYFTMDLSSQKTKCHEILAQLDYVYPFKQLFSIIFSSFLKVIQP